MQQTTSPPADPTYGYNLEQLLQVPFPAGPNDFDKFWKETYQEALATPTNLERHPCSLDFPEQDVWQVFFDSWGGVRIGAWLTLPKDKSPLRAVVVGHGYAGRAKPDLIVPGPPAVAIFPCVRGFNLSEHSRIPNVCASHVLHCIDSRESYVHRGCVADLWAAATALLELYPELSHSLHYMGGSFGGGLGALMLPWDARFKRAHLSVPSFGNYPLRTQLPCAGSGAWVREYCRQHPEVLDVLAYFDAATAASRIRIPVHIAPALSDPKVPPPGQFAVYNAVQDNKELFVQKTGHPNDEHDTEQVHARLASWFAL